MQEHIIKKFTQELDLNPDQQKIARDIIIRMDQSIKKQLDAGKVVILAAFDKAKGELAPHLDQEQKAKLDKMIKEIKSRPGPPMPPPPPRD